MLKHVLTPRIKATHVAFDCMKNYLDAIYDVTVAFEGTTDEKGQRKEAPTMTGQSLLGLFVPFPFVSLLAWYHWAQDRGSPASPGS